MRQRNCNLPKVKTPLSEWKVTQSDSLRPRGLYSSWNSPGQKSGMGSCSLLQGIFPIQGSDPGLPHCMQILYQLSHQGSPFSSIQFSHSVMSNSLRPHELQHARPPCSSPTPVACSNSCPSSQWCHPTISSSVIPFSSCRQSFPASRPFPMSQFFSSGGQGTGVSASASVLPMNVQDWSRLGWTGWISLQSKGLLRVFSNTTVRKHQFFGIQLSL